MSDANEGPLGAARLRRTELKQALSATEIAAAGAVGDPTWRGDLRVALDDLRAAWAHHVDEVEGPDGLLPELVGKAPRLASKVARLDDEHTELRTRIDAAIDHAKSSDPEELRAEVLEVLVGIARHRQFGADLVYEAYHVDIGGE
jgi:hypothetical protein